MKCPAVVYFLEEMLRLHGLAVGIFQTSKYEGRSVGGTGHAM